MDNFKRFVELNREKLYTNSVKADDISVNDEWMQENQWDETVSYTHLTLPTKLEV